MQHQKLNLGGTKATAETRNISKAMNITPAEETILKGLCESGVMYTRWFQKIIQ